MPSTVKRLLKRLSPASRSNDKRTMAERSCALSLPLRNDTQQQKISDQFQSALFATLPLEIRLMIYEKILEDGMNVVHVVKKPRKLLEYIRCGEKCLMEYNYKCSAEERPSSRSNGGSGLPPLLQSCRRT